MNKYKAADMILEFLIKVETPTLMYDHEEIQQNLFPKDDPDAIHNLLEWIHDYSRIPPLINYKEYYVTGTVHIKDFLTSGGFKKISSDIEAENIRQRKKEDIEISLAESNLKSNKIQIKSARDNKTFSIINIIFAAINLGLLIWQIIKAAK